MIEESPCMIDECFCVASHDRSACAIMFVQLVMTNQSSL